MVVKANRREDLADRSRERSRSHSYFTRITNRFNEGPHGQKRHAMSAHTTTSRRLNAKKGVSYRGVIHKSLGTSGKQTFEEKTPALALYVRSAVCAGSVVNPVFFGVEIKRHGAGSINTKTYRQRCPAHVIA